MNDFNTTHFATQTYKSKRNTESSPKVLLIFDLHQTPNTHHSLLDKLTEAFTVLCIGLRNQSTDVQHFHWTPTCKNIEDELSELIDQENHFSACITHGTSTALLPFIQCSRNLDIVCNPTLPNSEALLAYRLSNLLWSSTSSSEWFNQMVQSTWKESLPWPYAGSAPWISDRLDIQSNHRMTISNGTWKTVLGLISNQVHKANTPKTIVFSGSESPSINSLNPIQLNDAFPNTHTSHCIFPKLRQELLLAESIQQDILTACKENL